MSPVLEVADLRAYYRTRLFGMTRDVHHFADHNAAHCGSSRMNALDFKSRHRQRARKRLDVGNVDPLTQPLHTHFHTN